MSQRIFVTGLGIITSIGKDVPENFQSLLLSKTGIGKPEILRTAHSGIPVCEIKREDEQLVEFAGISMGKGFTRTATLGLIAAQEAIRSAGLSKQEVNASAFISATSTGGVRELEKYFFELQSESKLGPWQEFRDTANPGEHAERIADYLDIKEYIGTVSTACSSAANAIMLGAQMIAHGSLHRVICGGAEALSRFTLSGFSSLFILDKEHCRPFDEARKGLNLGEGAAYLILESEDAVRRSGRKPVAELKGYGNANDAFHQTASSPEGIGAWKAMNEALQSGNVESSQIGYINAHGTATESNDLSEGQAIQRIFGAHIPPFSSTKPFTGHTLAAAGSVEAVYAILALQHKVIFPNLNFSTPMKELTISPVTKLGRDIAMDYVLSNSFGFGGNTTSLLFGFRSMMEPGAAYINGVGVISPQFSLHPTGFLTEPQEHVGHILQCVTPDFKTYINPVQLRRLSRMLRIGLSSAIECLRDAKNENPDGIITATGYGFLDDTAKFLTELLSQEERQLTPTYFMQSTYNALGGLVALYVKCRGLNTTHVSKGFAFETALFDAMMRLQINDKLHFLIGSFDEADTVQFAVNSKAGHYKAEPVNNLKLFESTTIGALQGEGAAFFFVSARPNEQTWCRVSDLKMIYRPSEEELETALLDFMRRHALAAEDIDVVINGASGDVLHDRPINALVKKTAGNSVHLRFKHLSGEYCTASSFAVWMGASILKRQEIPEVARANQVPAPPVVKTILIINQYMGRNFTFLLLGLPD